MARIFRPLRDSLESILIAVFLALLVRNYILAGYKVPTSSMAPALLPGDFIFASRLAGGIKLPLTDVKFGVKAPDRGDLVVFTFPDQPRTTYVKRVIGLPGDKIQMSGGRLVINDEPAHYTPSNLAEITDLPAYDQLEVYQEKILDVQEFMIVRNRGAEPKDFGPLIVPPGEVFVLGDHRDASDDSRYWGTVPFQRIDGRVLWIWLSFDWENKWGDNRFPLLRTDRMMKSVR